MDQDRRRDADDIQGLAGVSGGGLEEDRDRTPTAEPVTRTVAEDRGKPRRVGNLNDKAVASTDDPTRTVTGEHNEDTGGDKSRK